jgi:hypothetical protein
MRDQRPVIRKSVQYVYRGDEIVSLVRAAWQLPPFRLEVGLSALRIDYFSMVSQDWLCGFNFSRAPGANTWTLHQVEYDLGTTLKRTLAQLGELEERGLKRLKYGQ